MAKKTGAWNKYIAILAAVEQKSADEMRAYLAEFGYGNGDLADDYAYALTTKYGEAAAEAACEIYDYTAERAGVSILPAEPAETASYGDVLRAVRGAAKISETQIPSVVSCKVKQAAADTTLKNAARDGAEWAWVPSGDGCAFCRILASNGWQRQSKRATTHHAEHIHNNCKCQYTVRFNGKGGPADYDPDWYRAEYDAAEGDNWHEKMNSMRRDDYAENADEINAQKRAAYAARQEKSLPSTPSKTTRADKKGSTSFDNRNTVLDTGNKKPENRDPLESIFSPASWDSSKGSEAWNEKGRKALRDAEWSSTYSSKETASVFSSSGKRIYKKTGGTDRVDFTASERKQMAGGILTHNHPNGSCFSPQDINMLRSGKLQEIRAVTSKGVYRIQAPEAWSKDISSLDKISQVYREIDTRVRKPFYEQAQRGEITFARAERMSQEAAVQELCGRYGMPYSFDTWSSIREGMKK